MKNEEIWSEARAGAVSVNPATGDKISFYPWISEAELEQRLAGANQAFEAWRDSSLPERTGLLNQLGASLTANVPALSGLITREMGKPIEQARQEVRKCAGLCHWYAENLERMLQEETIDVAGDGRATVSLQPLGCVLGVMPWNFPVWQVLRAAVPIIASGNTFLLKHADNVQGSALELLRTMKDAGLPDGVFDVLNVHYSKVPDILADPRIVGVSATAGVRAGAAIASAAAVKLKKSLLELGGSDPFIVLADADFDAALDAAIVARFQNTGQVCIAAKRIIIERPIAADFIRQFTERANSLLVGDPFALETNLGPMARRRLVDELHNQVQASVDMGATLLCGGAPIHGPGAYYPATVLSDVTSDMPVFREETFGPVAAITVAGSPEQAIDLANDSEFGLSASLWTGDRDRGEHLARQIRTGSVFVNGVSVSDPRIPIGGIKNSGYGRELSYFGLCAFSNIQMRWIR